MYLPPPTLIETRKLKTHPNNPRYIRKQKMEDLKRSISEDPKLMTVRPLLDRAMIKDNGHHGEFDMDILANGPHEPEQLQEWGVPIDWDKPEPEDEPKEPKQCKHCEKMIP